MCRGSTRIRRWLLVYRCGVVFGSPQRVVPQHAADELIRKLHLGQVRLISSWLAEADHLGVGATIDRISRPRFGDNLACAGQGENHAEHRLAVGGYTTIAIEISA